MRIITVREFRANQKMFFDLADKEKVIIHRGSKKKSVLLTPIKESEESDIIYFSDPEVIASIERGIADIKAGRVTRIDPNKNIWEQIEMNDE